MSKRLESRSYLGAVTGAALASGVGLVGWPAVAGEPMTQCGSAESIAHIEAQDSVLPNLAARIERLRASLNPCDGDGTTIAQFSNKWCNERCG